MGWRETLKNNTSFGRFAVAAGRLIRHVDDIPAFARALQNGEFEKARRQTDLRPREFADRVQELTTLADSSLDDDEVQEALDEYEHGGVRANTE